MNKLNGIFDKIYVVSYDESPRLPTIKDRLQGLDYEIFFGVNKKNIDIDKMKREGYMQIHLLIGLLMFLHVGFLILNYGNI